MFHRSHRGTCAYRIHQGVARTFPYSFRFLRGFVPELTPQLFSWNSPKGACRECDGLGRTPAADEDLVVPDPDRTLWEGAILPWKTRLVKGKKGMNAEYARSILEQMGILGEILHTPGHSEDSVSLLLDDGSVFTGDLPPEAYCWDNLVALESWRLLREKGATRVYPAHGPVRPINSGPPS